MNSPYHEQNWLERCSCKYRPPYFQRYVDDMFVLFNSSEHLKCIQSYLTSRPVNISFTKEKEKDNQMSIFDVNIILEQGNLQLLPQPTFSGSSTLF